MKKSISKIFAIFLTLVLFATMAIPVMAKTNKTSYDFFQSVGASKALQVLNDSNCKRYINRNSTNDAVNLDNMLASLNMIAQTNQYRSGEGLPALKITDSMMAIAQVNADYGRTHFGHYSNNYARLDNMAWGQASPAAASTSWYNEKYNNSNSKGHYNTMMGRNSGLNSTVTGAGFNSAVAYVNNSSYNNTYNETFDTNRTGEQTYTVSQYRTRLQNYMNRVGSSNSSNRSNSSQSNKSNNNATTRNSNGVYTCNATTITHKNGGTSQHYKDFRGIGGQFDVPKGKVVAYVQEMANDDGDGFYVDLRIFNGTGRKIYLNDITKINIYSDDGLICSNPTSFNYNLRRNIDADSWTYMDHVRFKNVNTNRNFSTGMLRVDTTILYSYV